MPHIDPDKLSNPLQKYGCQGETDETYMVLWHTDCDECMAHLREVMTLPGLLFMTHGSSYWCHIHQETHRCRETDGR